MVHSPDVCNDMCLPITNPVVTSARFQVLFTKLMLSHWIDKNVIKQNIKYMTGNLFITLKGGFVLV